MSDWTQHREVVSDDADIDRVGGYRLSIFMGGNGDWYVSILAPDERLGPCVRLATSGGASSRHPGLCVAIAAAYRALGNDAARERTEQALRGAAEELLDTFGSVQRTREGESE